MIIMFLTAGIWSLAQNNISNANLCINAQYGGNSARMEKL